MGVPLKEFLSIEITNSIMKHPSRGTILILASLTSWSWTESVAFLLPGPCHDRSRSSGAVRRCECRPCEHKGLSPAVAGRRSFVLQHSQAKHSRLSLCATPCGPGEGESRSILTKRQRRRARAPPSELSKWMSFLRLAGHLRLWIDLDNAADALEQLDNPEVPACECDSKSREC